MYGFELRAVRGKFLTLVLLLSPGFSYQATHASEAGGDAACLGCHQRQATPYQRTAHHLTSQLVTHESMRRSLSGGAATLTVIDPTKTSVEPGLRFEIKESGGHYAQSAVTGWGTSLHTRTESMDVILGSGRRGQTFLSWDGDRLFELPVSYWTEGHQWINSPGYVDGTADFSRPVNPGCLECHSAAIRPLSASPLTNAYEKNSLVPGISCATCHGASLDHVQTPEKGTILNPANFSRDRQVDLCALCHSGLQREELAAAFSFQPGEPLDKYFRQTGAGDADRPDVHGNQVGLLRRSRCYLSSPGMSCSTCHDVHSPERPAAAYSDRCLTCHTWQRCAVARKMGPRSAENCIDCHMPVQPTNVIVSETANRVTRATMRTHWIKIYGRPVPKVERHG